MAEITFSQKRFFLKLCCYIRPSQRGQESKGKLDILRACVRMHTQRKEVVWKEAEGGAMGEQMYMHVSVFWES